MQGMYRIENGILWTSVDRILGGPRHEVIGWKVAYSRAM